ncbi:MAG TPA: hypothetical protein VFD64_02355 [Gemmatimonadaceae bacterium]|nr:hypothetical protein [Gemmatimonadaceae bacterium]
MKTSAAILLPFLSVLLGASASAQPARRPVDALPGRVVDVAAGEYFLRAPDSIPAGLVTFRLSQIGDRLTNPAKVEAENLAPATPDNDPTRAFHMLWVARLEPGRTLSEWYAAHVKGEPTPWAVELGGPAAAEPPRTSNATMVLEPGNYVLVCHVGSARADKSRSHLLKGMFRGLTVTSGSQSAELPRAHAIARITGTGQIELQGTLIQGPQRIRVINATEKSHEFIVLRIKTGRTAREAVTWRRTDGTTHPFSSLGGFSNVPPGATLATTIDFGDGDHVLWTSRTPQTSLAVTIPKR